MTRIAVIDYGAGNLLSISRALGNAGASVTIAHSVDDLAESDGIVLPGVGAAGAAMTLLHEQGMIPLLQSAVAEGKPLFGVCLGMQLFCEWLDEDDCAGLGLVPGRATLLPAQPGIKVPHMGWNQITWEGQTPAPFTGLSGGTWCYFVHSYVCSLTEPARLDSAWTDHGIRFCAALARGSLWGVQFHPEKSGEAGLHIVRNFVTTCSARSETA